MDILSELKDIQFQLDQVTTDNLGPMEGTWLNRAKNKLMSIIADGERRHEEKFSRSLYPDHIYNDKKRGDPL